jgi:hypothetical protein
MAVVENESGQVNQFKSFMKQNVTQLQNEYHIVSDRFLNDEGEPLRFEFRRLKSKDIDVAREAAVVSGKKGKYKGIDTTKLMHSLIVQAVVYPDFNDKVLQDSYGVMNASDLIAEMLYADEYSKLCDVVSVLSGMDKDDLELVDEAKN